MTTRLEPGDWRAGDPDFTRPALSANLAVVDALRPVDRLDAGVP
jgi:hypothetical protein